MDRCCTMKQATRRLRDIVSFVENGHSVELTRRGKPVAVLISVEEYQSLHAPAKQDFWSALQEFRSRQEDETDDCAELLSGVRDTSPGRKVSW
jgi:antitoxin Phd